jgi:succinyl-diaminopimelate desuccinylase
MMNDQMKEAFLNDLKRLIEFPSVLSAPVGDYPYGQSIGEALEWFLALGRAYGFDSVNVDHQAGYIEFGTGEEIGILGHLDVVPVGDGWTYGPFTPTVEDGKLIGRGVNDDKGPTMAAFYAMRIVKEMGIPLKRKIRLILGTDEESGMRCIKHYLSKHQPPVIGFAPDATFPLIYAEKGIHSAELSGAESEIVSFQAGQRLNMVPEKAVAVLNQDLSQEFRAYLQETGLQGRVEGNEYTLVGKAAHAMQPDEGINAAVKLGQFLVRYITTPFTQALSTIDTTGNAFGIEYTDDEMGPITFNVGVVVVNDGRFSIKVNSRIPKDYPYMNQYQRALEAYGTYKELNYSPVHYVPRDSELVQSLWNAYKEVTGDEVSQPETIGGGTYARMLPNAVAFGAMFPGREDVAHRVNEYMYVEDLYKAVDVYTKALLALAT